MTLAIVSLLLGLTALLFYLVAEATFDAVFGYLGAAVVWLLTFGRIRLEPLRGGESELARNLGLVFVVAAAVGTCYLIQPS